MTVGPEPITAPGIHNLPETPSTTNAQLQALVKSRTKAIRYHLLSDVLFAVSGSVAGIPLLGPAVSKALSAWATDLEQRAQDAMDSATSAQETANYANIQLSILTSGSLASDVPGGVSINAQFNGAEDTNLGSDWLRVSDGVGGGNYGPNGDGSAVWKKFGGLRRRHIFRHDTPLATDYQIVICVMSAPVQATSLGSDAFSYLIARSNSAATTFLWVAIGNEEVSVGKTVSGSWSPAWFTASITTRAGDQWMFIVGTDTDDRQLLVKQNGVTRIDWTDTTGSSMGSGNLHVGLGAQAADRNLILDQTKPGELDVWIAADRLPTS